MQINSFSQQKVMNKSFSVLPVPEIIETNLNHSFKVRNARHIEISLFTFNIFQLFHCSSTSVMTLRELRNHQNFILKSSASPATVTTKHKQFPFVIR